jgi:transcriptional regulator with XRE-family HTH domain
MTRADTEVDRVIGERIHTIMWRRRLTQSSIADALGVDSSALGRKLRGSRGWSTSELVTIARMLDLEIELSANGCAIRDSNPEPADIEHAA